jgi:hypothetical protein
VQRQRVPDAPFADENLVADRPGRDGSCSGVVIASAHLDTVPDSPGADDDASGIAALLAIARASKEVPTERGLRLLAFALEEEGLVGSRRYVRLLSASERRRIVAVYNFDMIAFARGERGSQGWPPQADVLAAMRGRPLPPAATFIGAATLGGGDRATLSPLNEARAFVPHLHVETLELPPLLLRFAPDLGRGDHASFWDAGIPAVAIGDTAELRNPHYHAPTDTLETLDLGFGALVARWAAVAMLLAARPS